MIRNLNLIFDPESSTMPKCGFKWQSKYVHAPPSTRVTYQKQICIKPEGHTDEHESASKVTAPNQGEGETN